MSATSKLFPGYEILGELGRGTSGVVYEARHIGMNRRVALKAPFVASGADRAVQAKRVTSECRVLAGLTDGRSVGIPALHMVAEHRGQPYFVRELVDGDTLERRAATGAIDLLTGLAIVAEVARVVQWLHERGIAHRNLFAANVLVDRSGRPRLIGFGRVGLLSGSLLLPAGSAGTPAEVDVHGLRDLLQSLFAALRQPVPTGLKLVIAPGSATTAGTFAAAVANYLLGGQTKG